MNFPRLIPTSKNTFILAEDYEYGAYIVPIGYETNGADIPRVLWSIVPPFKPKFLPAVIMHDFLCSKHIYNIADNMFEVMLLSIEDSYKTRAMVKAVKFYTRWIR